MKAQQSDSTDLVRTYRSVAIIGSTGFVGSAVTEELVTLGVRPTLIRAPRLDANEADAKGANADSHLDIIASLSQDLVGIDTVINCAGLADSIKTDPTALNAANATLPLIIGIAASQAHCDRYVHVSSAVVQGRTPMLDDTRNYDPFSSYARSKIDGELNVLKFASAVVYRPPGVHGPNRPVTRTLYRLANSPLRTVAAPGTDPTPQALVKNVAAAIVYLALCPTPPPPIVSHPWEGQTTTSILTALSQKRPRHIPRAVARNLLRTARVVGHAIPALNPRIRRVEVLWFGQKQSVSWLQLQGWTPPEGDTGWIDLAKKIADVNQSHELGTTHFK